MTRPWKNTEKPLEEKSEIVYYNNNVYKSDRQRLFFQEEVRCYYQQQVQEA